MGCGTSPLGQFPFGYGTPTGNGELPERGSAGSVYLNPLSGDYEQDPDTLQLKQMPAVRQRVLLTCKTLRGSSSLLPEFGINLPDKMGTGFERACADAVRVAFRQMTDVEKVMRVNSVIVEKLSTGRAQITIDYTDLTTGESLTETI